MPTPSTVPPPPSTRPPPRRFTLAEYRAHNDDLEARLARDCSPELSLRKARAEIDAALAMISSCDRRRGRR